MNRKEPTMPMGLVLHAVATSEGEEISVRFHFPGREGSKSFVLLEHDGETRRITGVAAMMLACRGTFAAILFTKIESLDDKDPAFVAARNLPLSSSNDAEVFLRGELLDEAIA